MGLFHHAFWNAGWTVFALIALPVRLRGTGMDRIPRDGPVLVLSNHVALLDPFYLGWLSPRPLHFMASAFWFRGKLTGWFLRNIGAFPKMKLTRDPAALEALNELWAEGAAVGLFPEGRRSWDGRQVEVRPNIGKLILRLDAPVVYCRSVTGHLHDPRWSRWPRAVPVVLEVDGPYTYTGWSWEDIVVDVAARLDVDPDAVELPPRSWGFRLAEGLEGYLWACPECLEVGALRVDHDDRDVVRCASCGSRWRVDLRQRLHAEGGPATDLTVTGAVDRLSARFGAPPRLPDRDDGVLLEDHGVSVHELVGRTASTRELARGTLQLTRQTLRLRVDGQVRWEQRLVDLQAVSMEAGGKLQLRLEGRRVIRLVLPERSGYRWDHFTKSWRAAALEQA